MTAPTRNRRDDLTWQEAALCQETDPELFFSDQAADTAAALRLCRGCPSRQPCLLFALDREIRVGVWGGHTEIQRKALRRTRGMDAVA
jgi:WhiB family redox-sensing transcriptional regulator